jgi:glycosyltransferase involved in cell wall biosynthesis
MTETLRRPRVLLVSKPVVPPWNDSSKNLVRDLVLGTTAAEFTALTDGRGVFGRAHVLERPLYAGRGGFAPSLRQNARVVSLLLRPGPVDLEHFFFAPNPRTSLVIRALRRARPKPAVHTVCSVPRRFEGVARLLVGDVTVALSEYTAGRLREAGAGDVRVIAPAAPPLAPRLDAGDKARARTAFGLAPDARVVVFPGDYEFGGTAATVAEAAWRLRDALPAVQWVFACRQKTGAARAVEERIRARLAPLEGAGRVQFRHQVDDIHGLLSAADLVALPADTTYAKMDLPLVLLEALALGRPILVSTRPPLDELPVPEAGFAVAPGDAAALAECLEGALGDVAELERRGRRGVELARERFGRERMSAQYVALYRSLL